jgi:hypothetical protein
LAGGDVAISETLLNFQRVRALVRIFEVLIRGNVVVMMVMLILSELRLIRVGVVAVRKRERDRELVRLGDVRRRFEELAFFDEREELLRTVGPQRLDRNFVYREKAPPSAPRDRRNKAGSMAARPSQKSKFHSGHARY